RFERSSGEEKEPSPKAASTPEDWLKALLSSHSELRARASTAIRYTPDTDCFFRGEDPIERVAMLPHLLCLDLAPAKSWPSLDAFDPFSCNLVLTALTESSADEVMKELQDLGDQCEIQALIARHG